MEPSGPRPVVRRARWLAAIALGILVVSGPGISWAARPADHCSTLPPPSRAVSAVHERGLHLGFEDLGRSPADLAALDARLRRAAVDTVAISAGRSDWTAFPWPGRPEAWSAPVRDSGRDLLAEAVGGLGTGRRVLAVVDVLADRYVAAHPEAAARDVYGRPVPTHVSTVELVEGEFGRGLLAMIDYVARTYPVDSVDITELFYRDEGYGEDDARSYRARTGRTDWPRTATGAIDTLHPSIGMWRSEMLARFVRSAAELVHAQGKELVVDVRVSWSDLSRESEENGQCYRMLLAHADRLVVWNYFAFDSVPVTDTKRLAAYLQRLAPGRFVMGVGLWGRRGTVPADQLDTALALSERAAMAAQWVIPHSLMQDSHWRVLNERWAG